MGLAWQAYGLGHLAKSIHGYLLVYRNFDNEMKTNRWFAKYETGSDRFGEQVSRIEFHGFDNLEDAQAFCEKNARELPARCDIRPGSENPPALARFRIAAQAHSSVRSTHLQYSLKVPDARLYIARDRVCSARIFQAR
jgi:hypothetical protein